MSNTFPICPKCDDGFYTDVDGTCSECKDSCWHCSDEDTCTLCWGNDVLHDGKCVNPIIKGCW